MLVRENNGVIEAEIYPDQDYVKKKRIKDVKAKLQEVIDEYNKTAAPQKKIYSLIVRDTELRRRQQGRSRDFRQRIYLRGLSAQYLIYPGPLTGMQRFPPEGLCLQ